MIESLHFHRGYSLRLRKSKPLISYGIIRCPFFERLLEVRVTERSGKKSWVHWRLRCPQCVRQTFVEWAAASIRHAFWAGVFYQQQRDKGKAHHAAVRALAFTWIRMLYRCWQDRTPYDASVYLQALNNRGASLLQNLVHQS
jgi:hypothetical protein